MSSVRNENAPAVHSEIDSSEIEVGLASAMHDIQRLAASYTASREQQAKAEVPLQLAGVTMDPAFLLLPRPAPHREVWKGAALMLMVLCGLSTSALAITLLRSKGEVVQKPSLSLSLPQVSSLSEQPAPEPRQLPAEPPLYTLSESPGMSLPVSDAREISLPPAPKRVSRAPRVAPAVRSSEEANTCDEVACLIDGSDPCCSQYESVRDRAEPAIEEASKPYRLTRSQVMTPMQSILGRVRSCFDSNDYRGLASVKVVVSPEGRVEKASVEDGSPAFQACVGGHVEKLRFAELSQPFSFSFPYTYR